MKTSQQTIDDLLEIIADAGDVRARKMFGEYALYCDDKVVGLVCQDELFVKDTPEGQKIIPGLELAPAYPGAKPGLHVPRDIWVDGNQLIELIQTTANVLPAKK